MKWKKLVVQDIGAERLYVFPEPSCAKNHRLEPDASTERPK